MKRTYLLLILFFYTGILFSQTTEKKVVLQGFWWDYYNNNYPDSWSDYLTELTPRLKSLGIDAVWIPPTFKNHSTSSVGYSPFDHYDLGDKYQKGNTSTRIGKKDELLRLIGVLHANGIDVIQDMVLNHIDNAGGPMGEGGQDFESTYSTQSSGGYKNFRYSSFETPEAHSGAVDSDDYLSKSGRWSKNFANFHPHAGHNTIIGNWEDPLFGPDICFGYEENGTGNGYGQSTNCINGVDCYNPPQSNGYMRNQARDWIMWFTRQTNVDGFRWDAIKHYPHFIVQDLSYNLKYNNSWASLGEKMFNVGEFVGGKNDLDTYVNQVTSSNGGNDELIGTFDFSLRDAVKNMVFGNGTYDISNIPGEQQNERVHYYSGSNSYVNRTVPFVNNHDTFRPQLNGDGNYIGWNTGSELAPHIDPFDIRLSAAYAVIFAVDGNPQVFFEDLFNVGGSSKRWTHLPTSETDLEIRPDIANIIWCHQNLAFKDGDYKVRNGANMEFSENSSPEFGSESDHLIIDRSGKALIGINDNGINTQYNYVKTDFTPGTKLKDYSGYFTGEREVNVDGWFEVWTPPAKDYGNGRYGGYSVWAPIGQEGNNYIPSRSPVTVQEWEMADDLGDSHCNSLGQGGALPVNSTIERVVGKFYVKQASAVNFIITPNDNTQEYVIGFYNLAGQLIHSETGIGILNSNFSSTNSEWISSKIRNKTNSQAGQECKIRISYQAPESVDIDINKPENKSAIWTGRMDSSWNECGNWESGKIPDENTDVRFFSFNNDNMPLISGILNVKKIEIDEGISLSFTSGARINVHGDWINNGSETVNGIVSFEGSTTQTISGNTSFESLIINNNNHVTLNTDISIRENGSVFFDNGSILLSNYDVTLESNATISGFTEAKYFVTPDTPASGGFLVQNVGSGSTIYPVGTTDAYTPVSISNSGTSGKIQVRVFNDVLENGTTGSVVSDIDFRVRKTWEITPTISGANATISLSWNTNDQGSSFNSDNVTINKNIGGAGQTWNNVSSGSVAGTNPYTISATGITTFSKFSVKSENPLPVEMVSFKARKENGNALLEWITSQEVENEGFEIQRSHNGEKFTTIGWQQGRGNTNERTNYSFTDKQPENFAFYRLKQIDKDGKHEISQVIFFSLENFSDLISFSPNPYSEQLIINISADMRNSNIRFSIIDESGRTVNKWGKYTSGLSTQMKNELLNIPEGVYIISLQIEDQIVYQKRMVKK